MLHLKPYEHEAYPNSTSKVVFNKKTKTHTAHRLNDAEKPMPAAAYALEPNQKDR